MSAALVAKHTGMVFAGPVGSLDSYIDRVSQIPVLSKEDEVALAVRFRSEADLDAARQLVLSHLRFVCTSRAATWATDCRWAIWCRKAM